MLRNTAIAAALLLCAVAARSAGLLPEKRRVFPGGDDEPGGGPGQFALRFRAVAGKRAGFWNLGEEQHSAPSEAAIVHAFSEAEPYLAYSEGEALASAAGEVMSVVKDALGRQTVRLRHESGMETVYGNLIAASVREGDWVEAGQVLCVSRALTFEMRAKAGRWIRNRT